MIEEDDEEENVRTVKKQSEMLFVRGGLRQECTSMRRRGADRYPGDSVVLISPQQ